MVEDDIAILNLFICCKAFRRPRHKSGPCRFVHKYIKMEHNATESEKRGFIFLKNLAPLHV